MSPKAPRAPTLLVCGALTLGILLIYAPVRNFEFVSFDDPQYVIDNPAVEAGLTVDGLVRAFTGSHAANWHPLSWLSHMLDVEVFGLRAGTTLRACCCISRARSSCSPSSPA